MPKFIVKSLVLLLLSLIQIQISSALSNPKSLDLDVERLKVKSQLSAMVAEDQTVRNGYSELTKKGYSYKDVLVHRGLVELLRSVDHANTEKLKSIVKQWGWPKVSEFDSEVTRNAWIIVQHADQDVLFQERCLKLIEDAWKEHEVSGDEFAYLWDRVKTNRKQAQRFGTQGVCIGKGKWEPVQLEDAQHLDALRKSVGLPPFDEYLKQVTQICL